MPLTGEIQAVPTNLIGQGWEIVVRSAHYLVIPLVELKSTDDIRTRIVQPICALYSAMLTQA